MPFLRGQGQKEEGSESTNITSPTLVVPRWSKIIIVRRPKLGNASLFTKCLFTILVPLDPPPSQNSEVMDSS